MTFHDPEFNDPAVELAHRSAIRSIERVVHETATPTPPDQALDYVADLLRNGPASGSRGCLRPWTRLHL